MFFFCVNIHLFFSSHNITLTHTYIFHSIHNYLSRARARAQEQNLLARGGPTVLVLYFCVESLLCVCVCMCWSVCVPVGVAFVGRSNSRRPTRCSPEYTFYMVVTGYTPS